MTSADGQHNMCDPRKGCGLLGCPCQCVSIALFTAEVSGSCKESAASRSSRALPAYATAERING
eukprot:239138-Alexandrium_andersonii.AAC.1